MQILIRTREQIRVCGGNMLQDLIDFLQTPTIIEIKTWEWIVIAFFVFILFIRLWEDLS